MKYEYIINDKGYYYVPRAPSLCEAREREAAFKKQFGEDTVVFIVSPFEWKIVANRGNVQILEV